MKWDKNSRFFWFCSSALLFPAGVLGQNRVPFCDSVSSLVTGACNRAGGLNAITLAKSLDSIGHTTNTLELCAGKIGGADTRAGSQQEGWAGLR